MHDFKTGDALNAFDRPRTADMTKEEWAVEKQKMKLQKRERESNKTPDVPSRKGNVSKYEEEKRMEPQDASGRKAADKKKFGNAYRAGGPAPVQPKTQQDNLDSLGSGIEWQD